MLNSIVVVFQAVEHRVSWYPSMAWSLKFSLFITNIVLFLRLVMAYEVSPPAHPIREFVNSPLSCFRGVVLLINRGGEGTASPGSVVEEYGNDSASPGFEEGEGTRELGDDTTSPPPLSTTLSNY